MYGLRILQLCLTLIVAFPSFSFGEDTIEEIDKKLQSLYLELKQARKEAFNQEMEAQPLMFDNWSQYTNDIQKEEHERKRVWEIEGKIQTLEEQREHLKVRGKIDTKKSPPTL